MAVYRICDITVASNVSLPELPRVAGGAAESEFTLLSPRAAAPEPVEWFHHWRFPDGTVYLSCGRRGGDYLLRFARLADFLISADGRSWRCWPQPAIPPETIRHLLLDQVFPLVLHLRGRTVLHAGGVVISGGAVAFLGATGRGKSTITAGLSRLGFPLLTDDCLVLEESGEDLVVVPSYPGIRLWPDALQTLFRGTPPVSAIAHYTEKKRLGPGRGGVPFAEHEVPLRRLFLLGPPGAAQDAGGISIAPLSPRDALLALLGHAYRFDVTDRGRLATEFRQLGRWVTSMDIRHLGFPRDLARLPELLETILVDLHSLVPSPRSRLHAA